MNKNILHTVTISSVFLVAFFLPLSTAFANIALGVLLTTSMISFFVFGIDSSALCKRSFYIYTPLLFFIPVLIGMLYSPMDYVVFKELKRMLFIGVLPFIGLRKDLKPQMMLRQAAGGLLLGALCSALVLLVLNTYEFVWSASPWRSIFSYNYTSFSFTQPLHLHPIYLGSYYVMALVFIFNRNFRVKKWPAVMSAIILLTGVVFLNSRIIYGITFLISLLFLIENVSWKFTILIVTVLIVGIALVFPKLENTYLFDKLIHGTQWELSENIGTYNTDEKYKADSRFSRWEVAWELIKEHPIIGTGTGTERYKLGEKFKENHMKVSYESRYNAHNQFMGFTIRFGIIGLLLMVIYFLSNFSTALQHKDWSWCCFLCIIGGIFLIENYIDRNMGIDFVAFFGTLFYWRYFYPENPERYKKEVSF